jgi:TetR/AcrR family transcriptional repressor of nem operon
MEVMKGAGLTVGGFYNHFGSKEELFVETIRNTASTTWQNLLKSARGDSPRARTLSVISKYLARAHRDSKETGCLLHSVVPEVAREGEPYRSALEKELSGFVSSLAGMIEAGTKSREQALGLIALMYGTLSLSRAMADTRLSDEFLQAGKKLSAQVLARE